MDLDLNEPPQNLAGRDNYIGFDERDQRLTPVKIFSACLEVDML
jgi:hypothetical protein